jgi:hypothetical protein
VVGATDGIHSSPQVTSLYIAYYSYISAGSYLTRKNLKRMLLIFSDFGWCDTVMRSIHAQPCQDIPTAVGNGAGQIRDFSYYDELIATSVIYGKYPPQVWRQQVNTLIAALPDAERIMLFNSGLPHNIQESPILCINPDVTAFLAGFTGAAASIVLDDATRAALIEALQPPPRQRGNRHIPQLRRRNAAMHQELIRQFAASPLVVNDNDDDDVEDEDELQLVIQASLETEQPEPERKSLKRTWADVLKAAEPVKAGQPACIACSSNRASICILPCGHQSLCDTCVQSWLEVGGQCPTCRGECDGLIRPFLPGTE